MTHYDAIHGAADLDTLLAALRAWARTDPDLEETLEMALETLPAWGPAYTGHAEQVYSWDAGRLLYPSDALGDDGWCLGARDDLVAARGEI